MQLLRVHLISWTASFRYPKIMIGRLPTLTVPPLPTIYGLLSAATGRYITPYDADVGYFFTFEGIGTDLELVYEFESRTKAKTNILKRDFLFNTSLYLYTNPKFESAFRQPHFPLLLGRSCDLCMVDEIKMVNLTHETDVKIGGTILLDIPKNCRTAIIQSLPTYFSNEIPRRALGIRSFILTDDIFISNEPVLYDKELDRGIIIHTAESLGLKHQEK